MKNKIESLMEKDCRYIDIYLKDGSSFNVHQPNKNQNSILLIEDDLIIYNHVADDGCIYENYIKLDEVVYVTGIYNCPQSIVGDEDV